MGLAEDICWHRLVDGFNTFHCSSCHIPFLLGSIGYDDLKWSEDFSRGMWTSLKPLRFGEVALSKNIVPYCTYTKKCCRVPGRVNCLLAASHSQPNPIVNGRWFAPSPLMRIYAGGWRQTSSAQQFISTKPDCWVKENRVEQQCPLSPRSSKRRLVGWFYWSPYWMAK